MVYCSTQSRYRLISGFLFLAIALSGCATQSRQLIHQPPPGLPVMAELNKTPFFPQEDYQCGPAALAMSLSNLGVSVTPEDLISEVYIPSRQGSLQVEMLAATRRQGALSVLIPPKLEALLTEIDAGNPVIVLQNLGLSWMPVWHYAVAIGYDLNQKEMILRSGTTERLTMPLTTFEHTWSRGGYWGMVVMPPGQFPKTANAETAVASLIAFEASNRGEPVLNAYRAAMNNWPDNYRLIMGAGNAAFSIGHFQSAAEYFERALQQDPQNAPALNNLALSQAHLGMFSQARQNANTALLLKSQWQETVLETINTIHALESQSSLNRP
jgi:tetratricopeptide (TPR) repeat protein